MEQALINVLRNSIEAVAGRTNPTIDVTGGIEDEMIVINVQDNGKGIAQDAISQIFVPFYSTKPGGSGIGLALVRQVFIAHGGQVEVMQAPEEGVHMRMLLPATEAANV